MEQIAEIVEAVSFLYACQQSGVLKCLNLILKIDPFLHDLVCDMLREVEFSFVHRCEEALEKFWTCSFGSLLIWADASSSMKSPLYYY